MDAARRGALLLLPVLAFAAVRIVDTSPPTGAAFNGAGTNPGVVALTSLGPPSALTAVAAGHDVVAAWANGANADSTVVERAANGSSADCTAATTYATVGTVAAPTATLTDVGFHLPQGTYACYRATSSVAGTSWTSAAGNPVAAVQLGVVAASVALVNAGSTAGCPPGSGVAGTLDCGDQVVVTFNQPMAAASGPAAGHTVCTRSSTDRLYLGALSTGGICANAEPTSLGTLTSAGAIVGNARHAATYSWSADARTVTVTVGIRTSAAAATMPASTWTFTPTTTPTALLSATGGFHVCDTNTGGGSCLPSTPAGTTV